MAFCISVIHPVLYTFCLIHMLYACSAAWIDKCRPDILISESTYATTIRDSKRCRERDFLKKVHETIERGGKVGGAVSFLLNGVRKNFRLNFSEIFFFLVFLFSSFLPVFRFSFQFLPLEEHKSSASCWKHFGMLFFCMFVNVKMFCPHEYRYLS